MIDGVAAEDPLLVDRLIGAVVDKLVRAIGGENNQRHAGELGLCHGGPEVGHCGARGHDHRHRPVAPLGQPQRHKAEAALVKVQVTTKALMGRGGHGQRRRAGAGGQRDVAHPEAKELLQQEGGPDVVEGGVLARKRCAGKLFAGRLFTGGHRGSRSVKRVNDYPSRESTLAISVVEFGPLGDRLGTGDNAGTGKQGDAARLNAGAANGDRELGGLPTQHAAGSGVPAPIVGLELADKGERCLTRGAAHRRRRVEGVEQLPVADPGLELGFDIALEVLQQPQFENAWLGQGGIVGQWRQSAEDVGMYQPVLQPVLAVGQQLGGQLGIDLFIAGAADGARQRLGKEVAIFPAVEPLGGAGDKGLLGGELKTEVEAVLGVAGPLVEHGPGIDIRIMVRTGQHALPR